MQNLKKNNKGFTLVELIVVIAILGVLMAVLVPQYIQYVEKSRIGVDESLIGEVAHVMELSYAGNEAIATYNSTAANTISVTVSDTGIAVTAPATANDATAALTSELKLTFSIPATGSMDNFKSKTYGSQSVVVTMTQGKAVWTKVAQS